MFDPVMPSHSTVAAMVQNNISWNELTICISSGSRHHSYVTIKIQSININKIQKAYIFFNGIQYFYILLSLAKASL